MPLAVRDYGGEGPDVVLIHGAGRTLADWGSCAPLLSEYRLVAYDLRDHGLSGEADWTWEGSLDDLGRVIEQMGLTRPAVVGHSLGGMIAAQWGAAHPECPAAINLDGHGQGKPEQYDGMDHDEVTRRMEELKEFATSQPRPTITADQVEGLLQAQLPLADTMGIDREVFEEGARRAIVIEGDAVSLRPGEKFLPQLTDALESLDMMELWASVACPLLVINADQAADWQAAGQPEWMPEFMAAYRRGLTIKLSELAERTPLVTFEVFDGDHGLLLNKPKETAELVRGFLAAHPA